MKGSFKVGDKYYCIVPAGGVRASGEYYDGGPRFGAETAKQGEREFFLDERGLEIKSAFLVGEGNVWAASQKLIGIEGYQVVPLSLELLGLLPADVLELLLRRIHLSEAGGQLRAEIDWGGIPLRRQFDLVELAAGVAVWPPAAIPAWRDFFFLFTPGAKELKYDDSRAMFRTFTPRVHGWIDGPSNYAKVRCQVHKDLGLRSAVCYLPVPPRLLSFEDRDGDIHGFVPITSEWEGRTRFGLPGRGEAPRLNLAPPPPLDVGSEGEMRLAVDFGTSNTAVSLDTGHGPEQMDFTERSLAADLTHGRHELLAEDLLECRFFPTRRPLTTRVPSVLVEYSDQGPFKGLHSLPVLTIPGGQHLGKAQLDRFRSMETAGGFGVRLHFKWFEGRQGGNRLRKAFLEQLGLMVAWELRMRSSRELRNSVKLYYTRPLAFTTSQNTELQDAMSVFASALEAGGIKGTSLGAPISESWANLRFVEARGFEGTEATRSPDERHLVIDIGGGTTDITVFKWQQGEGRDVLVAEFLDSLYVGGKDLASSVLLNAAREPGRLESLKRVFETDQLPAVSHRGWADEIQLLLIEAMEKGPIGSLASTLSANNLKDTLAETLALLAFVTAYGAQMAVSQPPAIKRLFVWYAGLGSRLFDLSPLGIAEADRWRAAERMLKKLLGRIPMLEGVNVRFARQFAKESVCLGALHAAPRGSNDLQASRKDDELRNAALELRTLWWCDVPASGNHAGVRWNDVFERPACLALPPEARERLTTDRLADCFMFSVDEAAKLGLDHWSLSPSDDASSRAGISAAFKRAISDIRTNDNPPPHPVRTVTDQLKKFVSEVITPS